MYSCFNPSFSGACSTSIFIRMSAGTSADVAFEMMIMRPIASGTVQIAGCSHRMRISGFAAQKAPRSTTFRSLTLISVVQARAASPPPSMPVAAPFIVMPRHQTLMNSSGK
jgi:hypothetical protein